MVGIFELDWGKSHLRSPKHAELRSPELSDPTRHDTPHEAMYEKFWRYHRAAEEAWVEVEEYEGVLRNPDRLGAKLLESALKRHGKYLAKIERLRPEDVPPEYRDTYRN
ncbi:hypothetical protein [Streptomyces cinereoruber]|uniref:hypothetical protein n=1 Tax=Streptomyces cinereoruber TaxID=67260 RepID=UPI003628F182